MTCYQENTAIKERKLKEKNAAAEVLENLRTHCHGHRWLNYVTGHQVYACADGVSVFTKDNYPELYHFLSIENIILTDVIIGQNLKLNQVK